METAEILTTLLLVICLLATLSERARVPGPIIFLLGGTALAFVPALQSFEIEPQAILTIFLPPLLMEAAFFTSLRDFKNRLNAILQLAVGLVIVTATAVAFVFKGMLPDATLAAGFVLGAIVSPPDAVAATSIIHRMQVPRRIITIIEGESMINDASGLILYKFAVAAVMTGQFSLGLACGHFLWMIVCGPLVGLLIGALVIALFPRIRELSVEILITFVAPYVAYLLAEACQASGVLAVVATGLYVSWNSPIVFTPQFRIPAEAVWKMVTFVLGALVFILIGLKIPSLLTHLSVYSYSELLRYCALICGTAILVRFIYVFAVAYGMHFVFPRLRKRDPYPSWQNVFVIAFTGMRGVVSLATALALPLSISWGVDFPYRDLITFLALSLIVFTLIMQGLSLPWLLRKLTLTFDGRILTEDWNARVSAAKQALAKIEEIEKSGVVPNPSLERIKNHYLVRLELLGDGPNTPLYPTEIPSSASHPTVQAENRLWQDLLAIERDVIVGLRRGYHIGDDVMHEIIRELDLLANRFTT
jgi:CPA1 family monovalent cation:H+ antiporter